MKDFIAWANGGYTQAVAFGLTALFCRYLSMKWKGMSAETSARMNKAAFSFVALLLRFAYFGVLLGYFTWQLVTLLRPSTPPTRADVFAIAFWTFWLLIVFVRMLTGPFGAKEAGQQRAPQASRCSSAATDLPKSESSHSSNPTAAQPERLQLQEQQSSAP
ncbi:hypothetical protein [Comamonas thiooxydans]|uniref:hypothetical protein n=1 Tax=Comamonas thiooxydans TaxID=363952 RepID=UPI00103E64EA|nr:hypothetical protein [Comamonas thiooxydans]